MHAVAVMANVLSLHVVKHFAHLVWCELVMIQEGDEVGDGPLEIDIIFPKSIVGIDEKVLAGREAMGGGNHAPYYRASRPARRMRYIEHVAGIARPGPAII